MRIVGKKDAFHFTAQRIVTTPTTYYIFFENNRHLNDFVIKFFMRDLYNKVIPNITITNEYVSIDREAEIYIEGVA